MIVITGATGKVGSKISQILLDSNQKVRLIARNADKLKHFADKGAEIIAGSLTDTRFLTGAYKGANAVLTMLPVDFNIEDVKAYQEKAGESIFNAIKNSGIQHVLNISSVGGHTTEKTGIVAGLARLEQKLNTLKDVHILHLRCAYFMENWLGMIALIKSAGITGSTIKPDVEFPMIATKDIARFAAEKLMKPDFVAHLVQPLLGSKNHTMNEVAKILGKAIGKPDLAYVQFPHEQAKPALIQAGMSASMAEAMIGLAEGINAGVMSMEKRTPLSTTPTTIDEFSQLFAQFYNK